jgi:hypothetical protein
MSALGQKRTLEHVDVMSALPPKADMVQRDRHVISRSRPIGACTVEFSPVVAEDCKAPAHSQHILLRALSVLLHSARGK